MPESTLTLSVNRPLLLIKAGNLNVILQFIILKTSVKKHFKVFYCTNLKYFAGQG